MAQVVVLDTGLDITDPRFSAHICPDMSKDFTETDIDDRLGHGTHVAGLIDQYAGDSNYCLIVIKYTNEFFGNMNSYRRAIKYLETISFNILNFSGGGENYEEDEDLLIKYYHPNSLFFVAAGNEHQDLNKYPYYPASLPLKNIVVVGSKNNSIISSFSNYGNIVKHWENGEFVLSTLPMGTGYMQGTSQATAIATGKYLKEHY